MLQFLKKIEICGQDLITINDVIDHSPFRNLKVILSTYCQNNTNFKMLHIASSYIMGYGRGGRLLLIFSSELIVYSSRAAVVRLNLRAGLTFPVPVCIVSPGRVNKANTQ